MATIGRPPKPIALKVLNGSAAHDPQRVNKNPAQPAQVAPVLPPGMSPRARDLWHATLAQQAPGVILAAHRPSLRAYVEATARYEEAAVLLAGSGPLVRADGRGARRGELVKNPLVSIVRGEADLIRVFARELGLTPSSVSAFGNRPPVVADDPILALLTPCRPRRRA